MNSSGFNMQIKLFDHIEQTQKEKLFCCLTPEYKSYLAGETITDYQSHPERVGVILSGHAQIVCSDINGNSVILEELPTDAVFGELFLLPLADRGYIVEALTDCQVLFIQHDDITKRCEKACAHHSQLVDNLFCLAAVKARNLNIHLQILSQRSTRDKILCYLAYLNQKKGEPFELPMTWTRLADYLCVNRSALMREIHKLKEENLLQTQGRYIILA
jgi:CRP-like cAMP-binding protein